MGFIILAVGIFALDLFVKKYMDKKRKLGEETFVCNGKIILRKYYNKGVALDALKRWPGVVKIAGGAILLVLGGMFALLLRKKSNAGLKLGMAMVLGGGANNLYDRFAKGHVVDYFSFQSPISRMQKIVFNLSDMFIFLGTALMALFYKGK